MKYEIIEHEERHNFYSARFLKDGKIIAALCQKWAFKEDAVKAAIKWIEQNSSKFNRGGWRVRENH